MKPKIAALLMTALVSAFACADDTSSGDAEADSDGVPDVKFTLVVTAGTGGTIEAPSGGSLNVVKNASTTITAKNNATYKFSKWVVVLGAANIADTNSISTTVILSQGTAAVRADFTQVTTPLHVATTGNDSTGDGTTGSPYLTITKATGELTSAGYNTATPGEVRVSAGTYNVTSSIMIQPGISLKGGYNATYAARQYQTATDRSNVTYKTALTYTGAEAGAINFPSATIRADESGITTSTLVEGFTINGRSGGVYSSAVRVDNGLPIARYNTLNGGAGATESTAVQTIAGVTVSNSVLGGGSGNSSYGVKSLSTALTIENNVINGGSGALWSRGIFMTAGTVSRNTISVGAATNTTGVQSGASATLMNNIIDGGGMGVEAHDSVLYNNTISGFYAIYLQTDYNPTLTNNILFNKTATGTCILEVSVTSDPVELKNNSFYNCPTLYRDENATDITTIGGVNALADISGGASNNVLADPVFVNLGGGDWHLSAGSPTSITQGGLDLSGLGVTVDADNAARTAPFSIGGYEKD